MAEDKSPKTVAATADADNLDKSIGADYVRHLYNVYLGENPDQSIINLYKNDITDDRLRKDLELQREKTERIKEKSSGATPKINPGQGGGYTKPKLVFRGKDALVSLTSDPDGDGPLDVNTIYILDSKKKTLRPFTDEKAFIDFTGLNIDEATNKKLITKLSPNILIDDDYQLMEEQYGVGGGGEYTDPLPEVSSSSIQNRYGKEAVYGLGGQMNIALNSLLSELRKDPNSGISSATIDQVVNNPNTVGLYLNALAYGDYGPNDIVRDLKRIELVNQGRNDLAGMTVIHPDTPAPEYFRTTEGMTVRSNPDIAPPQWIGDIDTSILDNPVMNLPPELFQTLVPPLNPFTPEGKAEIENIKASFYDITMKQLEATTEREKAVADYQYNKFKELLSDKYNIQISQDAMTAWKQLENFFEGFSKRGLSGSGIEAENIDDYLREVRQRDTELRKSKLNEEEQQKFEYLTKYGSPEQIAELSEEEKVKFGFKPSTAVQQALSAENLKAQFPDLTDEQINKYRSQLFDSQGNFRSNLYGKLASNLQETQAAKRSYQEEKAFQDKLNVEEKAYAEYTKPEAFSKPPKSTTTDTDKIELPEGTAFTGGPSTELSTPTDSTKQTGTSTGASTGQTGQSGQSGIDWGAALAKVQASGIPEFDSQWGADTGDRVNWALKHRENIFNLYKNLFNRAPEAKEVNEWLQRSPNIGNIEQQFKQSQEYKDKYGGNA